MTTKSNQPVTITVLSSGLAVPVGDPAPGIPTAASGARVAYRGEVVTLSPEQVEDSRDGFGNSWLDLADEQQVARWGKVKFAIGDHSDGIAFIGDDDSTVVFRRRENALLAARKIQDPAERKAALTEITKLYGHAPSTQTSTVY